MVLHRKEPLDTKLYLLCKEATVQLDQTMI